MGLASLVAFVTQGALTTAQHLAADILRNVEGADPDVVAEESLALLAIVTARAVGQSPEAAEALAELPLTFRDYVLGGQMLESGGQEALEGQETSYERIARKLAFYQAHFAPGRIPGPRLLSDKMELWMGRVSPPGLPESPAARLEKLDLVRPVVTHVRLVRAFLDQG